MRSQLRFAWGARTLAAALVALTGCRSCSAENESRAGAGPTMPAGLLVPVGATEEGGAPSLRVAHHVNSGPFAELQLARPEDHAPFQRWRDDATFVSFEAMTMLHEAFARALPGFDLFLPRLFEGRSLEALMRELEVFAGRASGDIAATASELAAVARDASTKGLGLRVLGM